MTDIFVRIRFETSKSIEKPPTKASWRSRDSDSADFAVRGLDSSSGAPQPNNRFTAYVVRRARVFVAA